MSSHLGSDIRFLISNNASITSLNTNSLINSASGNSVIYLNNLGSTGAAIIQSNNNGHQNFII